MKSLFPTCTPYVSDRIARSQRSKIFAIPFARLAISGWVAALLLLGSSQLNAEEATFDSKGVKIHYNVEGQGEPVVLIHGLAANGLVNWEVPGVSKELAKDYKVIVIDCRGHGRSDKPHEPEAYGVEMADDIVRLLDHLKIKKAHVVGYSMGGLIAHKLSVRHPDRLLTLTLGGIGWMRTDDPVVTAMHETLAKSLDEGKGLTPLFKALAPAGKPAVSEEHLELINKALMAANDTKALSALIRQLHALGLTEKEAVSNKVPTLAIIGSDDPLKVGVERLKETRAEVEVVEIQEADHMSAFSHPEFISALRKFLAKYKI